MKRSQIVLLFSPLAPLTLISPPAKKVEFSIALANGGEISQRKRSHLILFEQSFQPTLIGRCAATGEVIKGSNFSEATWRLKSGMGRKKVKINWVLCFCFVGFFGSFPATCVCNFPRDLLEDGIWLQKSTSRLWHSQTTEMKSLETHDMLHGGPTSAALLWYY